MCLINCFVWYKHNLENSDFNNKNICYCKLYWSFSVPLPPGPILRGSSNFAYDNLIIKWTAPANNTFVTKYRVSVDGTTQQTSSYKPEIHFIAKDLTPGMNYTVKIVTVSGTTDDVQESSVLNETIRITPTSKKMMCLWIWF